MIDRTTATPRACCEPTARAQACQSVRPWHSWPRVILAAAIAILTLLSQTCVAWQDPKSAGGDAPILYRELLLQDGEQLEKYTRGNGYTVITREQFNKLIKAANEHPGAIAEGASLHQAVYVARLNGHLLQGRARFDIVHREEGSPARLLFSPCRLAVDSPVWLEHESTPAFGMDHLQRMVAIVERGGPLGFRWALQGSADRHGQLRFGLSLPRCPITKVVLILPERLKPVASAGHVTELTTPVDVFVKQVTRTADVSPPADVVSAVPDLLSNIPANHTSWLIDLGGKPDLSLIMVNKDAPVREELPFVQQSDIYRISPQGLDVTSRIRFDRLDRVPDRLTYELQPPLRFLVARLGAAVVTPLQIEQSATTTRVILPRPDGLKIGQEIEIDAIANLSQLQAEKLPPIPRVVPRDVFWQQGTASLQVDEALSISRLIATDCRQTRIRRLPESARAFDFAVFSPDATIQATIEYRRPEVTVDVGTTIDWAGSTIRAHVAVVLRSQRGKHFQQRIAAAADWTIDPKSITTDPPERLRRVSEVGGGVYELVFNEPVSPGVAVRIELDAARGAREPTLSADALKPVVIDGLPVRSHRMAISAGGRNQVALSRDYQLRRRDSSTLADADGELVALQPGSVLLDARGTLDPLAVTIQSEPIRFSVEVDLTTTLAERELTEAYRIACTPESQPVDALKIVLSVPRPETVYWSVDDGDEAIESADRTTLDDGKEEWTIAFRRSYDQPFELVGRRSTRLSDQTQLSLAEVRVANAQESAMAQNAVVTQDARLAVKSHDGIRWLLNHQGLTSLPAPVRPATSYDDLLGYFRYDVLSSRVSATRATGSLPPAWAWNCLVESFVGTGSTSRHQATWQIETNGRRNITISVPSDARINHLYVDGQDQITAVSEEDGQKQLVVALPPQKRFPVVRLCWSTRTAIGGFNRTNTTAVPRIDIAVLDWQHRAWIPPGFSELESRGLWARLAGRPSLLSDPFATADAAEKRTAVSFPHDGRYRAIRRLLTHVATAGLSNLDRAPGTAGETTRETIGETLTGWTEGKETAVFVDASSLAPIGITSASRLPTTPAKTKALQAAAAACRSGIAFVAANDGIVLTGLHSANKVAGAIKTDLPGVFLADSIATSFTNETIDAARWQAYAELPGSPWIDDAEHANSLVDAGWDCITRAISLADIEQERVRVTVQDSRTADGFSWLALLAGIGMFAWGFVRRPHWVLPALAAIVVVAIFVPAGLSLIATRWLHGCLLGILAGSVWQRALLPPEPGTDEDDEASQVTRLRLSAVSASLVLLCVLLNVVPGVLADDPDLGDGSVWHVIIRVDENEQRIQDDYAYYIMPEFQRLLERRASRALVSQEGWLIHDISWQATIDWNSIGARLDCERLDANLTVEVFRPGTKISLPLAKAEAQLLGQPTIEGQPLPNTWNNAETHLEFTVEESGTYLVQFAFRPRVHQAAGWTSVDMPMIPHAAATIRVSVPVDAEEMLFPTAIGERRREMDTGNYNVQLGAANRLVMKWPSDISLSAPTPIISDELLWLNVQPDAVTLDLVARIKVIDESIQEIPLRVDPRLRMLPLADDSPVEAVGDAARDGTILLRRRIGTPLEFTVRAGFLLSEMTGVGQIKVPLANVVSNKTTRQWLAVNIAPELKFEHRGAPEVPQPLPSEFQDAWTATRAEPQLVFDLINLDQFDWTLVTRPVPDELSVRESWMMHTAQTTTQLSLTADLDPGDGQLLETAVRWPKRFHINDVVLSQGDRKLRAAWSVANDKANVLLSVVLESQADGPVQLDVRGTFSGSQRRGRPLPIHLPSIGVLHAATEQRTLAVFQSPGVQVQVGAKAGWVETEKQAGTKRPELDSRLIASLQHDGTPTSKLTLEVGRVIGSTDRAIAVTSMRYVAGEWIGQVELDFRVKSGRIEVLRLEIPQRWNTDPDAFQFTPDMHRPEIRAIPGGARYFMTLFLKQPLSAGRHRVTISAPLQTPADGPFSSIDVKPLDPSVQTHLLALPKRQGKTDIRWDTQGMRRRKLPEALATDYSQDEFDTYGGLVQPVAVRMNNTAQDDGVAEVRLAEFHVVCQEDDRCYGHASFDMFPGGRSELDLILPENCHLLHASVDGVPAPVSHPGRSGNHRISVGSGRLAHRVEVLFAGAVTRTTWTKTLFIEGPKPGTLPILETIWTVYGSEGETLLPVGANTDDTTSRIRLSATRHLLEQSESVARKASPRELDQWRQPWLARLASMARWAQYDPRPADAESGSPRRSAPGSSAGAPPAEPTPLIADLLANGLRTSVPTICSFNGSACEVTMSWTRLDSSLIDTVGTLLILVGIVALAVAGLRRQWFADSVAAAPLATAIALSVLWWLVLEPGFVGLMVVTFFLLACRTSFRRCAAAASAE